MGSEKVVTFGSEQTAHSYFQSSPLHVEGALTSFLKSVSQLTADFRDGVQTACVASRTPDCCLQRESDLGGVQTAWSERISTFPFHTPLSLWALVYAPKRLQRREHSGPETCFWEEHPHPLFQVLPSASPRCLTGHLPSVCGLHQPLSHSPLVIAGREMPTRHRKCK